MNSNKLKMLNQELEMHCMSGNKIWAFQVTS